MVCKWWFLFRNAVLSVFFAMTSTRKTELVVLLELCYCCCIAVNVLFLFVQVSWVCLWPVIVASNGLNFLLVEFEGQFSARKKYI